MTQKLRSYKGSYRLIVTKCEDVFECPVCGYMLKYDVDFETYFDKGACTDCVDTYYYQNADRWNSGWRPNLKEETIDEF